MKFIIDNWLLILTALVSGGMLAWPALTRKGTDGVSTHQAVMLINREKAVVLDVCDPGEFAAGHALGAKNVPLANLQASNALPKNKSLPVVVVCQNGARASKAVAILRKLGYERATALNGGMSAWREAHLPVEKAA